MSETLTFTRCRHCGRSRHRPYGLCRTCYDTPAVRGLYAPAKRVQVYGLGRDNNHRPLPAEPTRARPGTPEKIDVLGRRAEKGEALFHPLDNQETESW